MKSLWWSFLDGVWRMLDVIDPQRVPVRVLVPASDWPEASRLPSAQRHSEATQRWSPEGSSRAWQRRSLARFARDRRG